MPDSRTYANRAEYIIKAVSKRRIKLRQMACDYKGDKCVVCGYKKCKRALVFHHVDPKKKSFGISARGLTKAWSKIQEELDKCVLLCSNCHMRSARWYYAASY